MKILKAANLYILIIFRAASNRAKSFDGGKVGKTNIDTSWGESHWTGPGAVAVPTVKMYADEIYSIR